MKLKKLSPSLCDFWLMSASNEPVKKWVLLTVAGGEVVPYYDLVIVVGWVSGLAQEGHGKTELGNVFIVFNPVIVNTHSLDVGCN